MNGSTFWLGLVILIALSEAVRLNLAKGKSTSQISTTWGGWPNYAVDGNKETNFFNNPCTHTDEQSLTWWMVDLLQQYIIMAIEITTRQDQWTRLANFTVEISRDNPSGLLGFPGSTTSPVCARQFSAIPSSATFYYQCEKAIRGRYIRVVKYRDHNSPLSLCEFEAYGPNLWRLEKVEGIYGSPDILQTLEERQTIIECAKACVHYSGYPCKHVQINRVNGTCRLLKSFQTIESTPNLDWDMFSVIT